MCGTLSFSDTRTDTFCREHQWLCFTQFHYFIIPARRHFHGLKNCLPAVLLCASIQARPLSATYGPTYPTQILTSICWPAFSRCTFILFSTRWLCVDANVLLRLAILQFYIVVTHTYRSFNGHDRDGQDTKTQIYFQ